MSHPRTPTQLALYVLAMGKPFTHTVLHEEDVESGPFTVDYHGFRLGAVKVENHRGHVSIEWPVNPADYAYFVDSKVYYLPHDALETSLIRSRIYEAARHVA